MLTFYPLYAGFRALVHGLKQMVQGNGAETH